MTPPNAAAASAAPPTRLTVDEYWDFCQRPENADRRTELIRGEVFEMPRPTKPHGVVATNVAFALKLYVRQGRQRGYVAANDSGVILEEKPGTVVGPDVAYYTDAHRFDDLHPKWGDVPPVLAVEILSPNDKLTRVNKKVRDYLRNGVR
ncbi:MAG: Uma2 family endonuclease, partial [Fimbriiglobus sp.]